jgi:GNAT superfamily N-acetyltransferase
MRLGLLQLSDIHIDNDRNPVLKRPELISAAAMSCGLKFDAVILALCGDIAFSGAREEYDLASELFASIRAGIGRTGGAAEVHVVAVPGNHDCNLRRASDVRDFDLVVPRLATMDLAGDLARHWLEVQDEYFDFVNRVEGTAVSTSAERLFRQQGYSFGGYTVTINCFNTAWLTQNPERPSKLYFPLGAVRGQGRVSDLSISLFHHPFNWLDPNNAQQFKRLIEPISDLVLTGHEHVSAAYAKRDINGGEAVFVEALPLWDARVAENGFQLVIIEPEARRVCVQRYVWDGYHYAQSRPSEWANLAHCQAHLDTTFDINGKFAEKLTDIGTGFTHPRKRQLCLSDLYVYPDLRRRKLQARLAEKTAERVRSKDTASYPFAEERLLVIGADKAGKTSLARSWYTALHMSKFVPVLLHGDLLRGDEHSLMRIVSEAFTRQYSASMLTPYKQLDRSQRVLIVDNFHRATLRPQSERKIVEFMERWASKTILLVDDFFHIEQITDGGVAEERLAGYGHFEILPLPPSLRGELISKWVELSDEGDEPAADFHKEISEREKLISTLLGRQLLPSYPIFILGILQAIEAGRNVAAATGSYGELFESLITDRLAAVSGTPTEIGTKYTYIARLAYSMFSSDRRYLALDDVREVSGRYQSEFDMVVDPPVILAELVAAQILYLSDARYRFKYPNYYHFFVARYFRDNLNDPEEGPALRAKLKEMTDRVYYETYAAILVFFIYFTRDADTIAGVCGNAERMYDEHKPCDLDLDVDFLNKLYIEPPKPILLQSASAEERQERRRAHQDAVEEGAADESAYADEAREVIYSPELADLLKMHIAFKNLHILGQVLRSFPGVLRADVKSRIALACNSLGLRVLSALLTLARTNLEALRAYFSQLIREQRALVTVEDLAKDTDDFMLWLTTASAYGIIKRISTATGSQELKETYRSVIASEGSNLGMALVDLSIKLDHFSAFPEREVDNLRKRTRKNWFAFGILRHLIADYLYIYDAPSETRQSLGRWFDIQAKPAAGQRLLK